MSDFRTDFEEQLVAAAHRLAREPDAEAAPTRVRRLSRRVTVGACAAVLVAGTALAATHPWAPPLGNPEFHQPPPSVSPARPPRDQLQLLGVLRRSPTAADHGVQVRAALRYLSGASTSGVRTDYVRRLDDGAGSSAVTLIPVARWRPAPGEPVKRNALCVFAAEPSGQGGARTCWTTADVRTGRAVAELGHRLYGLAPDGVAQVNTRFAGGSSATTPVIDNFFELTTPDNPGDPDRADAGAAPAQVVWLDAAGAPIGPPLARP